jgi:hypothetical protein
VKAALSLLVLLMLSVETEAARTKKYYFVYGDQAWEYKTKAACEARLKRHRSIMAEFKGVAGYEGEKWKPSCQTALPYRFLRRGD